MSNTPLFILLIDIMNNNAVNSLVHVASHKNLIEHVPKQ